MSIRRCGSGTGNSKCKCPEARRRRYVEKQESSVVRAVGRSGRVLRDLALMGDRS